MTKPAQARPVHRGDAIDDIAAHFADRDAFVISVPPALIGPAAERLATLPACTWYSDNGSDAVMRMNAASLPVIAAIEMLLPGMTAAVVIVPKTVPAAQLAEALDHLADIPEDGSKDLLCLTDHDGTVPWPQLLVDALSKSDPGFALRLAANDLRRMS